MLTRDYDIIGFGDEVPGVLALVSAAREFQRRQGRYPRTLLLIMGSAHYGIGGHLVRGRLAYLDRSHLAPALRRAHGLSTFGEPATIYSEFLQRAGVRQIALDPGHASYALRQMLSEVKADILSLARIATVYKDGDRLETIELARGERYRAQQFIDSTVNAELAKHAGARRWQGFGTFGLPESELPVSLVFETHGITIGQLQWFEQQFLKRFANLNDRVAQGYLRVAAGNDQQLEQTLRDRLVDDNGRLRTMYVGPDFADVRAPALSIAYQSFRGKKLDLQSSLTILDQPNIAILGRDRLSWNALLHYTSGQEAEALASNAAQPSADILEEMRHVERWLRSIGASFVTPARELYIRHAGNVIDVVQPLSGAQMLAGGIPAAEALGSFAYYFDVRGGIRGIGSKALELGFASVSFGLPTFNYGIRHAQLTTVPNLAVISPGSGFTGFASSAGRIVEFNVGVGQGIGIAAAIALEQNRNLATVTNLEVRAVLEATDRLPKIYGQGNQESAVLANFERALAPGASVIA
ncbi:MAG: FAD-dependent oxidoreductase [Spirulinaceae cyanobacterium SM2_1_0]|nr:FAD-dependent oxidoreductase [Spirulinaceae cyanobacterium SM2_1_0]